MRWTIEVPNEKRQGLDIHSIIVATEDELQSLLKDHPLDSSFPGTLINLPSYPDAFGYNDLIVHHALNNQANLAVRNKEGSTYFYRVQERKNPGVHYVGVGVGIAIYDSQGDVLLTLRSGMTNNRCGTWDLPGGTVELGDTLEDTVRREAKEETGLDVEPLGCICVVQDCPQEQHWISLAFAARVIGGKLDIAREPYRFADMKYFPTSHLPKNTAALTRKVIEEHARNGNTYISVERICE